jgi:hypothetical protein
MKRTFHVVVLLTLAALSAVLVSFLPAALAPVASQQLVPGAKTEQDIAEGLKRLSSAEVDALLAREKSAYVADPLNRGALQNTVALLQLKGQKPSSEAVAIVLADFSRRSLTTQLVALQLEASKGEFASAFDRIDGVLRAKPEQAGLLFPSIRAASQNDEARKALAGVLGRDPPWRWNYFSFLVKADDFGAAAYALSTSMRKSDVAITDTEKRSLLDRMFSTGKVDAAYFIWLDLLPQHDLTRVRSVFDGGFDTESKYMFFDWNFADRKNAKVSIAKRPGKAQDRVLLIDMQNDDEGKQFVHQYTRLQPGEYVLSYESQVDNMQAEKGLIWRMGCLESGDVLSEGTPIKDAGPWQNTSMKFTVPEANCATQYLRLVNQGTTQLDIKITGRVMIDNVRIDLASAAAETPAAETDQQ